MKTFLNLQKFLLFLIVLSTLSCQEEENTAPTPDFEELIIGEWENSRNDELVFYFCEDRTGLLINPDGEFKFFWSITDGVLRQRYTSNGSVALLRITSINEEDQIDFQEVDADGLEIDSPFSYDYVSSNGCVENSDDSDALYYNLYNLLRNPLLPTVDTIQQVSILFQVTDFDDIGVPGLTTDDFIIYENGDEISASESEATIAPLDAIPYEIKTILLLDVSKSVEANLDQIKTAAQSMVDNISEFQKIAVYTFDGKEDAELIIDFTDNTESLKNAIDGISIGDNSTNLYQSIRYVAGLLEQNSYTLDEIKAGNIIVFTDGNDTAGRTSLSQVTNAVRNRDVYMLGLGDELNESALEELGEFYPASDIDALEETFLEIQSDIEKTARSVYWLYYTSPKRRGNNTLRIEIKNNTNISSTSFVEGFFDADSFD